MLSAVLLSKFEGSSSGDVLMGEGGDRLPLPLTATVALAADPPGAAVSKWPAPVLEAAAAPGKARMQELAPLPESSFSNPPCLHQSGGCPDGYEQNPLPPCLQEWEQRQEKRRAAQSAGAAAVAEPEPTPCSVTVHEPKPASRTAKGQQESEKGSATVDEQDQRAAQRAASWLSSTVIPQPYMEFHQPFVPPPTLYLFWGKSSFKGHYALGRVSSAQRVRKILNVGTFTGNKWEDSHHGRGKLLHRWDSAPMQALARTCCSTTHTLVAYGLIH